MDLETARNRALVITKARRPGSMGRGGLLTNLDLVTIDDRQRDEAEVYERNVHEMEEVLRADDGTNSFLGLRDMSVRDDARRPIVSKRQLHMTHADVMEQRRRNEKVKPIYYDPKEECWVLPDAYKAAQVAGYLCMACLEWQETPHSKVCRNLMGHSCGHVNHDNPL